MESRSYNNKRLSYEEINKVLQAHEVYLSHHKGYIDKIERGLVSEQEMNDYLSDVFKIKKVTRQEFIKSILPTLKETIDVRIADNNELIQSTQMVTQEQGICFCQFSLAYQMSFSRLYKHLAKSKDVGYTDKIQAAFDRFEDLKILSRSLEDQLPDCITDFNRIFKIKEESSVQQTRKQGQAICSTFIQALEWETFVRDVKLELDKSLSITKGTDFTSFASNDILQAPQVLRKIADKVKINKAIFSKELTRDQAFKLFKHNVEFFFEVYPTVKKLLNWVNSSIKTFEERKKVITCYNKASAEIKMKLVALEKQHELDSKLINKNDVGEAQKELDKNLSSIKKTINKLFQQWPAECPSKLETKEQVNEKLNNFYESENQIIHRLEEVMQRYTELKASVATNEALAKQKEQNEIAALKKQREAFLIAKKADYQRYKEETLREREQKKHEKEAIRKQELVLSKANPIVSNNNNVTCSKDVSIEEQAKLSNNNNFTLFKNVTMTKRLKKLSPYYLGLLKSILKLEIGITFDDIYYLITNQLGGKISEIGNGSSHKRIELEKLYVEVWSSGIEIDNDALKIAVGGTAKPHGKPHNNGVLSRFSLELVRDTLLEAKITLEEVEKLEQAKQNENANSPCQ